jgi:hypothetical protein
MKKNCILLFSILIISLSVNGKNISLKKAKFVAVNFYSALKYKTGESFTEPIVIEKSITEKIYGKPAFYVFNFQNGGFVIVSADDVTIPVLGFSLYGAYTEENKPVNLNNLLNSYKQQTAEIRKQKLQQSTQINQLWNLYTGNNFRELLKLSKEVEPLINSTWHQVYPYNALCPEDPQGPGGFACGWCGSAASTQLMHYYKYPNRGTGSNGYSCTNYGWISADFENTVYEWDAMPNNVQNLNIPVATLIYHFGIAAYIEFGPAYSFGEPDSIRTAFLNHFDYSSAMETKLKANCTLTEWQNMLMTQLDEGKPVLYWGQGGGGHAWLIDGYLEPNYYHCNWNWSGAYNGYYYLDDLSPGQFNFTQDNGAIFNIVPNSNNYPYYCNGTDTIEFLTGQFDDGSGPINKYNDGNDCYWLIAPNSLTGIENITLSFEEFNTELNHDILTVYEGSNIGAPVLGSFSGNEIPEEIVSTNDTVLVRFISDNNEITNDGWLINYSCKEKIHCSGTEFIEEPNGIISDGSADYNYRNNSFCTWIIEPDNATYITLIFNEFDTEENEDFLKIYDISNGSVLLGSFSGSDIPNQITGGNKMKLRFTTNNIITANGWSVNYNSDGYINIDEINNNLSVYPNPVKNKIQISGYIPDTKNIQFIISNINGKKILQRNININNPNFKFDIDIHDFANGIYLLKIQSDKNSMTKKIVKL